MQLWHCFYFSMEKIHFNVNNIHLVQIMGDLESCPELFEGWVTLSTR